MADYYAATDGVHAKMNIQTSIKNFFAADPIYAGMIPPDVTDQFPLIDSGALDSIGIFNLVSFLEKTFSVTVEPQDLNESHFKTVDAIAAFVRARQK